MNDLFNELTENDISVHLMLDLQERYPNISDNERHSYNTRSALRVSLLTEFVKKNNLPLEESSLRYVLKEMPQSVFKASTEHLYFNQPSQNQETTKKMVTLLSGGPASGKSRWIKNNLIPPSTVILDRDSYFERLSPYPRLKLTHPNHATHVVVCEAILYNERDAYQYALQSGAQHILVDGTMSYRDLGHEMITSALDNDYHVQLIHIDCDITLAIERAKKRANKTGKTIHEKLLYESHVRCSYNFLEYRNIASEVESWNTDGEFPEMIATKDTILNAKAFERLQWKSTLPLNSPSWPPNFNDFLNQR